MDSDEGVQKNHERPTPRVGGIAIAIGLLAGFLFLPGPERSVAGLILVAALPALLIGVIEDITKTVPPRVRLMAALLSGGILLGIGNVLAPLAIPLTPDTAGPGLAWAIYIMGGFGIVVGLAGTTNAMNIIDGYHGLAAGSVLIMCAALAGLSALEGDWSLVGVIAMVAATVSGFFIVNFPRGYLFLGDGGAYLSGFVVGSLALLVAVRTDVSAFVTILVMAHPIYETLFSMFRKSRRPGYSPMQPDRVHLHNLVSRRFARFIAYGLEKPDLRNPLTGVLMWPFSIIAACLAILAQGTNIGGLIGLLVFGFFYARIYKLTSLQSQSYLQPYSRRWGWDETSRFAKKYPAVESASDRDT